MSIYTFCGKSYVANFYTFCNFLLSIHSKPSIFSFFSFHQQELICVWGNPLRNYSKITYKNFITINPPLFHPNLTIRNKFTPPQIPPFLLSPSEAEDVGPLCEVEISSKCHLINNDWFLLEPGPWTSCSPAFSLFLGVFSVWIARIGLPEQLEWLFILTPTGKKLRCLFSK